MSNTHQSTTGNNQLELWNVLSQLMEDNAPSWQLFQWCLPDSLLHRLALVMVQEIFAAEEAAQRPPRLEWYRSLLTKQRWLKQEASDPHLSSAWYKARHSFSRLEAKGLPPIQRIVWKVARSAGDRNGRRSAIVISELWIQYRLLQNETTANLCPCSVGTRVWRAQNAESIKALVLEQNEMLLKLCQEWMS